MGSDADLFRCTIADERNSPDAVYVRDLRRDELVGLFDGLTVFPIDLLVSITIERVE